MSLAAFFGAAGTGKTTRLMAELERILSSRALADGQRVLAITRMHGARHRLDERLRKGPAKGRFECMTLDRLAWIVAARWRGRAEALQLPRVGELDFDATCELAATLLHDRAVARWLSARFPVVIVDEFQDCRGGRLGIVKALASVAETVVAADEFQDLAADGASPSVEWVRGEITPTELSRVYRTNDTNLLGAATAIRSAKALVAGWGTFSLAIARNKDVAASFIAKQICWARSRGKEVVLLAPTGPAKSRFVREALSRVAAKPIKDAKKKGVEYGPYSIEWERSADDSETHLREALAIPGNGVVTLSDLDRAKGVPGHEELKHWAERRRSLKGQLTFSATELRDAIARATQQHRAHARPGRRLRAMTIHQAKNREFDQVIVLWPFEVQNDPERARRLLYNAVTRAKEKALVIVQDPKEERLAKAPFA